jgi:hypothetical protein
MVFWTPADYTHEFLFGCRFIVAVAAGSSGVVPRG